MLPRVYPSGCKLSIRASKKNNFKKIATVFAGVFFVAIFLLLAQSALAQVASQPDLNFGLQPVEQNIGLGGEDIRLIIARIIRAVLGLLGIIAICLMLWAGYTIMTAGGNEEKIQEGKKILINAVIGLAIILSAFAIAQFVINMLAQATGYGNEQQKKVTIETFAGSGALGKIVKDHYPERDQVDVVRNTKIIITFAEPMMPNSFIVNKNLTCWPKDGSNKPALMMKDGGADCLVDEKTKKPIEYYGDCLSDKPDFNWDIDCDNLLIEENKKGEQNFFIHPSASSTLVQAAAMASFTKENDVWVAKTFVFKPLQPLGDDLEKIWYTVKLNNGVKKADGGEAFAGQHYQYYEWEFQTGTNFDFSPPYVVSVFPWPNKTEYRNTIVQLNFNEAMDPMMVQGVATPFDDAGGLTSLVLNFGTTTLNGVATGEWKVSNGYKTAEFVSDKPCGLNSCGEMMYCLQLDCKEDDYDCVNKYATLVRTAEVMPGGQPFEAKPFSGVMDVAGNALDGNKDGTYQKPPDKGKKVNDVNYFKHIGDQERTFTPKISYAPDNYGWDFAIKNDIDRTAPYLEIVEPGLDAGGVKSDADVRMNFSKLMWVGTLANIGLQEYPEAMATSSEGKTVPVDFFFYPQSSLSEPKTITWIKHRKFGPNGFDYYYSPEIPGSVKSTNQNCLYPGYGPGFPGVVTIGGPKCELNNYNEWGVPGKIGDCAPTTNQTTSSTDTGCVQTIFKDENGKLIQTNASTTPCLDYLKGEKISKPFPGTK